MTDVFVNRTVVCLMGKDVFINSTVVYLQWDRRVCKKDCGVLAMLNECRGEREWR